jgi:Tfp pilus assembly protein PilV
MALLNKKIRAFTVVETMAALLIVSISLGAAFSLYNSTLHQRSLYSIVKADILLNNQMLKTKQQQDYSARVIKVRGMILKQEFFLKRPGLYVIRLTAFSSDSIKIHVIQELLYLPHQ